MKNPLLILLVFIMFSCDTESIASLGQELTRDRTYQVGLCTLCDDYGNITWYCVSETEYNTLKGLPKSCEIISITSLNGNAYSGIINSDSFRLSESPCIK